MALFQINLSPTKQDLRWFAGLWFPAFAGIVGYVVYRRLQLVGVVLTIWGIAATMALLGLWVPRLIRPLYNGMMRATFPIGWVVSNLLLLLTYYSVISPAGVIMRLFHDPMQRKFEPHAKTYWISREQQEQSRYLRQV